MRTVCRAVPPREIVVVALKTVPFALLLGFLAACGMTEPTEELVLGDIEPAPGVAPEFSVQVDGGLVSVEVRSFGNTCVSKGELRVDLEAGPRRVTVSPFDRRRLSGGACGDILLEFDHATTLTLEEEGLWTVVARGRTGFMGPIIEVERDVEIVLDGA